MGKRHGVIAVLAVVATMIVTASLWLPAALAGDTQVHVFDPEGKYSKLIDIGKPGFSAGDQIVEIHTLLDPTDGSNAGKIYTQATILKTVKDDDDILTVHCSVVLPSGTIAFYGRVDYAAANTPSGASLPVTGGTGDYELARGTVNIVFDTLNGDSGSMLTFDLTTT